jgi:hypothetical protein
MHMSPKPLDYLTPIEVQKARPRLISSPAGHAAIVTLIVNTVFLFAAWFFMNYLFAALFALISFALNTLLVLILLWRTPNVRSRSLAQSMWGYVMASILLPLGAIVADVIVMNLIGFRWMQS